MTGQRWDFATVQAMCSRPKPRLLDRRPDETTDEWLARLAARNMVTADDAITEGPENRG